MVRLFERIKLGSLMVKPNVNVNRAYIAERTWLNICLCILRHSTNERIKCQIAKTQRHDEFVTPLAGIFNFCF